MATAHEVATIFRAVDHVTPILEHIKDRAANMASAVRKAFTKELGDITLGNIMARGITSAFSAVKSGVGSSIEYASSLVEVQNVVETVFR
jgi:hypothetical protein